MNNIGTESCPDVYLWLQRSLCAASAIQADALIHTVVSGKIIAHLVTVATPFILCAAVSAALRLRRLLEMRLHKSKFNFKQALPGLHCF